MLTKQQQEKISKCCTKIYLEVITKLPEYLSHCEVETSAAIIADMVKAGINLQPAEDPEDIFNDYPEDDEDDDDTEEGDKNE